MNVPAKLRLMAAIPLAMVLGACAHNEPPVLVLPPAELARCADEPLAPDLPAPSPETQRERDTLTLGYILALRSAWGDCRAKVKGLATWMETAGG